MKLPDVELDWRRWFERWEAMMQCYIPQRLYRFDLMLKLGGFPRSGALRILDLGCGPGSLAYRALAHYSSASAVAVDFDPVLLAMGRGVADQARGRIEFVQADLRDAQWWAAHDEAFDLIVSATALHWLSEDNHARLYPQIYRALKPGGWFFNADHMRSDDEAMQGFYRELLDARQTAAFSENRAERWNDFWEALGCELGQVDLSELRNESHFWEGTDDGYPKAFHVAALRESGFANVAVHWQDLGEAIVGARKSAN